MERGRAAKRNEEIYRQFREFWNQGFRLEIIYKSLADQFYLSEQSVQKIILKEAKKQTPVVSARDG